MDQATEYNEEDMDYDYYLNNYSNKKRKLFKVIVTILFGVFFIITFCSFLTTETYYSIENVSTPALWIFSLIIYALALFTIITTTRAKNKIACVILPFIFTICTLHFTNIFFADDEYHAIEATIISKRYDKSARINMRYEFIMDTEKKKNFSIKTNEETYNLYNEGDVVGLNSHKGFWNTILIKRNDLRLIKKAPNN